MIAAFIIGVMLGFWFGFGLCAMVVVSQEARERRQ